VRAIEVAELTKAFGPIHALRGITLGVDAGDALVIFGPNGAGKTTLLKTIATLIRPTSGSVRLFGMDPRVDMRLRAQIGVVSHQSYLYPGLTGAENLLFAARLYGVPRPEERVTRLLETVGLAGRAHDLVRTYSRGMAQRLSIARSLVQGLALCDRMAILVDGLIVYEADDGLRDLHAVERIYAECVGVPA